MKRQKISEAIATIPNNSIAAVAGMIADPTDFPVVRKSGLYNTAPTAVGKPFNRKDLNWTPTVDVANPTGMSLPKTDMGGFIFRNPMRAMVLYNRYGAGNWKYNWQFNPNPGEPGENALAGQATITIGEEKELYPVWAFNDALNTFNPHGSILWAGEDDGHRYIYVDGDDGSGAANQIFTVQFTTPTTVAASRKMYLYRYDSGIRRLVTTADSGAIGNTTFNITLTTANGLIQSGYYSVTLQNNEATSGVFTFNSNSVNTLGSWEHYPAGQFVNQKVVTEDMRVMAVNLLVQNKSAELTKQGKAAVVQAIRSEDWISSYANPNMFNIISSTPGAKVTNWAEGLYAFLKPTKEQDMEYLETFQTFGAFNTATSNFVIEDTAYALQQSDYLVFCISTTVEGAGDATLLSTMACEYRTRSMWQNVQAPSISPEEFELGVQAVISMEQFYTNPVHWAKIFSTIGKIARVAAPLVAKFAPYGALIAPVISALGDSIK